VETSTTTLANSPRNATTGSSSIIAGEQEHRSQTLSDAGSPGSTGSRRKKEAAARILGSLSSTDESTIDLVLGRSGGSTGAMDNPFLDEITARTPRDVKGGAPRAPRASAAFARHLRLAAQAAMDKQREEIAARTRALRVKAQELQSRCSDISSVSSGTIELARLRWSVRRRWAADL